MRSITTQQLPTLRWRWARSIYRAGQRVWLRSWQHHLKRVQLETIDGWPLIVLPGVFNGVRIRSGLILARSLETLSLSASTRVLDLGTGSGLGAIFAARQGARVIASDVNPEAVRCAKLNALANHLDDRIEVRSGDLFESVPGERFDVILFNPPYYRGQPRDDADRAWRSPDVFDRFLMELPDHLTDQGCARVVLSTDGEIAPALLSAAHLKTRLVAQHDLIVEILTVYEVRVA
jgi:release factor glutamine methyltransferase